MEAPADGFRRAERRVRPCSQVLTVGKATPRLVLALWCSERHFLEVSLR